MISPLGARKPLPASGDTDREPLLPLKRESRWHSLNHITGDLQLPRTGDIRGEARVPRGRIESQRRMGRRKPAVIAAALAVLALGVAPVALGRPATGASLRPPPPTPSGRGDRASSTGSSSRSARSSSSRSRRHSSSSSSASAAAGRPRPTPRARRSTATRGWRSSGRSSRRSSSSASPRSCSPARRPSRRRAATARTSSSSRSGAPVLLAVRLPGRAGLARPARPPGRPARQARAGLLRRQPQLVGAGADRQARRHPGQDERAQLHARAGRGRSRAVRRALRHPPHGHADDRRGRLADRLRGVPPAGQRPGAVGRDAARARPGDVGPRLRRLPRPRGRGRPRPADRAEQRRSWTPEALHDLLENGQDTPANPELHAPRRRAAGPTSRCEALIAYVQSNSTPGRARRRPRRVTASGRSDRERRSRPGAKAG